MRETVEERRPLANLTTAALVGRLLGRSKELVRKEVELARSELRESAQAEVEMAKGVGVAGLFAIATVNLLLVAVVLLLSIWLAGWLSALIVAALVLSMGTAFGFVGWSKRARHPFERTRGTLKEDIRWMKERRA